MGDARRKPSAVGFKKASLRARGDNDGLDRLDKSHRCSALDEAKGQLVA
jgi:hypothetical protein